MVTLFISHSRHVLAYADTHLQSFVQSLQSYIKDTCHFLKILHSFPTPLPSNTLMVSTDVTSLYINIPHIHGPKVLEKFLS
jgi:hypothetical protein